MIALSTSSRDGVPRRVDVDARLALAMAGLTALATVLMLEATRVFLSYTVFVVDQEERVQLAVIAVAVFLAYGLAALVVRVLGVRDAIVVAAGAAIGSRLALQFWDEPVARIVLGAAATVSWGWLLIAALGVARDPATIGVGIGLVMDLSIRIAFRTVDLPWMPDLARDLATVVLGILAALSAVWLLKSDVPGPAEATGLTAVSLVAIGPALAVYHLAIGNLGFLMAKSDRALPVVGLWVLFGAFAGLGEAWRPRAPGAPAWRELLESIAITLLSAIGLWLLWRGSGPGIVWMAMVAFGSIALLMRALGSGGRESRRDGVMLTTVWITAGMLLQTVLVFAYFSFTGHPVPLALALLLLVACAWLPGQARSEMHTWSLPRWRLAAVVAPLVVVVVSGVAYLAADDVEAGEPLGRQITVMTYNIHLGFSRDNRWNLEQTARTIEAEHPDVVILQEVSRGWVIASGVDQVRWLSERLDMPIVFGASSRDGLWGNVILAKAPIKRQSVAIFSSTQNLRRGVVVLQLAAETGDLWVFGTHLDNPDEANEVRLEQVGELLEIWDGRTPAILAGDFNATPDSDVLATLIQAGFVDTGTSLGQDATTSENGRRIDYVMVAGPITTREVRIPDVWTSDHRPVVAELTIGS